MPPVAMLLKLLQCNLRDVVLARTMNLHNMLPEVLLPVFTTLVEQDKAELAVQLYQGSDVALHHLPALAEVLGKHEADAAAVAERLCGVMPEGPASLAAGIIARRCTGTRAAPGSWELALSLVRQARGAAPANEAHIRAVEIFAALALKSQGRQEELDTMMRSSLQANDN
jgi:hypothetical protein